MLKKKDIKEMYKYFNHFSMFGGKKYSFCKGNLFVDRKKDAFLVANTLNLVLCLDKFEIPKLFWEEMKKDIEKLSKKTNGGIKDEKNNWNFDS